MDTMKSSCNIATAAHDPLTSLYRSVSAVRPIQFLTVDTAASGTSPKVNTKKCCSLNGSEIFDSEVENALRGFDYIGLIFRERIWFIGLVYIKRSF